MEIIYTKNPNVINYDSNAIVFHGWPTFKRDESGNVEQTKDEVGGVDILTANVETMQRAVTQRGWRVRGPSLVRMKRLTDGSIQSNAIQSITIAQETAGVSDDDTLGTYIRNLTYDDVRELSLSGPVEKAVIARCLEEPDAPNLTAIKKLLDKSNVDAVVRFVKEFPTRLKGYIRPIELAINTFAVELLKGIGSSMVSDTDRELQRLRAEVLRAIKAIESSNDETAMAVLRSQMEKLKSVENITSPMEGVVFIYKGNAYKFTGSFAAAGQILGLFKYGRGGTKLKMQNT